MVEGCTVGCSPPPSSVGLFGDEWKSIRVEISDFQLFINRSSRFNFNYIESPEFSCNGHMWHLRLRCDSPPSGEEYASVCLQKPSKGRITTSFQIDIIDKFGKSKCCGKATNTFAPYTPIGSDFANKGEGFPNFVLLSDILDKSQHILDYDISTHGTLTFVISIAEVPKTEFVPKNPFKNMMREMFNATDICFEVVNHACADKGVGGQLQKKSKSSVSFHAHRSIVNNCAPMLADLFGANDTATISDIKPDIFRHLLHYVYGGDILEDDLKADAKDIINAADKYAIINLKLAAEVAYVDSIDITMDNAIDNLLYADGKNCALLKERVMKFLADNPKEVAQKISFTDCPGRFMKDLVIAFSRKERKDSDEESEEGEDELTTRSVSTLRRKLYEMGLEVDGSREAMIESIKNSNSNSSS